METPKVERGSLLLSEPFMFDPNFKRTVILMTDNTSEGGIGFVLNKPTNLTLPDVLLDINDFNARLFHGGPVQPETLHFVHNLGNQMKDTQEISPGIFWGGDFEQLKDLIDTKAVAPKNFKFFLGYSGWSPGQLENELKENSWIVTESKPQHVFSNRPGDLARLWNKILEKMGGDYRFMSTFPEDPRYN